MDLSWVTAIPGAALVAFPMTWVAGPVATYNLLALLAPALSGWTAFLLARRLTRNFWASFLAGYLFGFSAYEVGQSSGHLNLTLVFLVPLAALLVLKRSADEISRRAFIAWLALVLVFQFLISTEIFVTTVFVGGVLALVARWRLPPDARRQNRRTAIESGLAIGASLVAVSPYLLHAFVLTGPSWAPVRSPFRQSADVLNFVFPTHFTWLRPPGSTAIASHFSANPVEAGAYVGLPLLLIVLLAAGSGSRTRTQTVLLLAGLIAAVCALGSRVRVDGHTVFLGPWEIPAKLPITHAILPVRLAMFVELFAALITASWLAQPSRRSWARWALAVVAGISLLPTPSRTFWTASVPNPRFFANETATSILSSRDTVLVLPFGKAGWSMLWQAENHMHYRMVGGYLGNRPPTEERWQQLYRALIQGRAVEPTLLKKFLQAHGAAVVIVSAGTKRALRRTVERLPASAARFGDVTVYRLKTTPRSPAG